MNPGTASHGKIILYGLMAVNILPELVLQGADAGWWGETRWRFIAYSYGALWQGLLGNWRPNFELQPLTMFLTYGFLHSGLLHLAGNMIMLAVLSPEVTRQVGPRSFLVLYAASLIGGALAFVLLSDSVRPMIGASGAVYGIATAWIHCDHRERRRAGLSVLPTLGMLCGLLLTNAASWWLLGGELAWEAHAGGMAGAWICADLLARRRERRDPRTG